LPPVFLLRGHFTRTSKLLLAFQTCPRSAKIPDDVRDDLNWFLAVLALQQKFNSIPVEYFACIQPPSREVMMDASDTGLCALEPQLRQFIRVQFTEAVRRTFQTMKEENSINVRELMSAALAALYWGPAWTGSGRHRIHVRMKIDNTSAVSWLNKRSSGEPVARIYNRLISLSEFRHSFTCSAEHIPGELNTMADAGSRAWTTDHPLHRVWTN
jgi:hypothetical protein